jgi:hypothetical protein
MDVLQSNLYVVLKTHRITTQLVVGRTLYYKPDCERARDAIAAKRAEREAKQQAAA